MAGLIYAALAALGDVLGGLLIITPFPKNRRLLAALVAFGGGFMLSVAITEMIPAAFNLNGGLFAVLIGYLIVHLTQHMLTPHFHFGEETHSDEMVSRNIGVWALVGLVPHAVFDGVAISSGFLTSHALGILIFGAVILHKVPEGVALARVMLASGNSARKALIAVVIIAVATVLGALITPVIPALANYGLALAAGVTIYVAASNLIPESQHERGWLIPGGVIFGVVAYYLARMLLPV
ncbi:MAG TPA: ZIP family metal transporter [Longimicrobiales bacterium]|nr:ZIP family metal transporter [Longimicrobiales bacterium]